MRKKFKVKKRFKIKYLFYIFLIYISFVYTFYFSIQKISDNNNKKFINLILSGGNTHLLSNYKVTKIVNGTVKLFTNIDLTKPLTVINQSIFKNKNSENIIKENHEDDYSNLEELKKISFYIEDPNKIDEDSPKVYLYNTHQLENYKNDGLEIYNITPNVLMASYILKEKLNKLGIPTIVEDTNITNFLQINNWDYASSYKASRLLLLDKKSKYDSLKYFIDIHRDSANKTATKVTIDGKDYAKVMFVIGLEHDNYKENIEVTTKLNKIIKDKYPTLSRGIYKKEGKGVDGIYNQDISKNTILIEIGGVDNNITEVFNTLEVLSKAICELIGDNNE